MDNKSRSKAEGGESAAEKEQVRSFWEAHSCGEVYAKGDEVRQQFEAQANTRYSLEPFIWEFADFPSGEGKDVLEVGVGMGADHLQWARSRPRSLCGIDLTHRAVETTRERLLLDGFFPSLNVADAENLPFKDTAFDLVYSWGVLHHSPDTERAINEVYRVLRPGGEARVMIYHTLSLVGVMLWLRYALFNGTPFKSLGEIYSERLESPGTKAFSTAEARVLFRKFSKLKLAVELSPGDLLAGAAGQRHKGRALEIARSVWPRRFVRRFLRRSGLFLLIRATK